MRKWSENFFGNDWKIKKNEMKMNWKCYENDLISENNNFIKWREKFIYYNMGNKCCEVLIKKRCNVFVIFIVLPANLFFFIYKKESWPIKIVSLFI